MANILEITEAELNRLDAMADKERQSTGAISRETDLKRWNTRVALRVLRHGSAN